MPICIECRHPVKTLWTQYSGAGDPSSGHNIRLTVCKNCGRFCDKYVEHDFVVLFIDLVLIKPQKGIHITASASTWIIDHDNEKSSSLSSLRKEVEEEDEEEDDDDDEYKNTGLGGPALAMGSAQTMKRTTDG
ncbi:hypothetical protein TruAng_006944 [Truncatella angustata]|nr:hypothetical protein TruAng_006944 [Truncatella angustata]